MSWCVTKYVQICSVTVSTHVSENSMHKSRSASTSNRHVISIVLDQPFEILRFPIFRSQEWMVGSYSQISSRHKVFAFVLVFDQPYSVISDGIDALALYQCYQVSIKIQTCSENLTIDWLVASGNRLCGTLAPWQPWLRRVEVAHHLWYLQILAWYRRSLHYHHLLHQCPQLRWLLRDK